MAISPSVQGGAGWMTLLIERAWSSEFKQVRVQIAPLSIPSCMMVSKLLEFSESFYKD